MDHKERRNLGPKQSKAPAEVQALFAQAVQHHAADRLEDAERLYRHILKIDLQHADSLHRLGVVGYQRGQFDVAVDLLHRAIALSGKVAPYHVHLSSALAAAGRLEDAARSGATAVELAPSAADAHINLGLVLMQLGRLAEAADCCRQATLLAPDTPDAHGSLGAILQEMGQARDAAEAYRRAISLDPDYPEAHTGLGNALLELGSPHDAITHHRRAIALRPDFAEANYNVSRALLQVGDLEAAMDQLRVALRIDPRLTVAHCSLARILRTCGRLADAETGLRQALMATRQHPDVLNELALTLLAQGRRGEATKAVASALAVQESTGARSTFVACIEDLDVAAGAESMAPVLLRALRESWARPERLARVSLNVIYQDPAIGAAVTRANALWPGPVTEEELCGDRGVSSVAANELLQVLLCATPNADFAFERFLTLLRQILLDRAEKETVPEDAIGFYASLANQCFLNEYVFRFTDNERLRAGALRERLVGKIAGGEAIVPALLLAVSSYYPLASLPGAERLLDRRWPAAVETILAQQIREVREEVNLRADITRMTPIQDSGSVKVQAQYEASPYPRWLDAGSSAPPQDLTDYLVATFPLSGVQPVNAGPQLEILVAGCGTGRNALDTARAFKGGRTLAIDLSIASLAHALRKTREAGVTDVIYAQADILEVRSLGRTFDLIESVGVLHHLSDPLAGWRALLATLRPGGAMKLGFYSALARQKLPQMDVDEPDDDAIRAARQRLGARTDEEALEALLAPDLYSVSGCRDLLFHVQETRFTIGEIAAFLRAENMTFLGFILPDAVLAAYRQRFPQDKAATDLGCWDVFEQENPNIFAAMYQFWVQRRRPLPDVSDPASATIPELCAAIGGMSKTAPSSCSRRPSEQSSSS